MSSYYEQAVRVYETTADQNTKGIIAALLHLAGEKQPPVRGEGEARRVWETAAIRYIQDDRRADGRSAKVCEWLIRQGFDVQVAEVQAALWQAVQDGELDSSTEYGVVTFKRCR